MRNLSRYAITGRLVVLGCVGLALAGCGPDPRGAASAADQSPTAAPDIGYHGPSLPGLQTRPVAYVQKATAEADTPSVVGNAFAFVNLKGGGHDDPSGSAPATVTFYDAATGRERATVDVPLWDIKQPQVGEFNGAPAIFLHGVQTTGSDGLSQESETEHQIGFDASGRKVVDMTWNETDGRVPVAGWTATTATGRYLTRPGLTVYAADGAARLTLPSDHAGFGDVQPVLVGIVGDVALVRHARPDNQGTTERYLAAYDLARLGAPLWTSDATHPGGATGLDPHLAFVSGHKIGLVWPAGMDKVIVSVQEARTGRVDGTTPVIEKHPAVGNDSSIEEADNARSGAAVLALAPASTYLGSVAVSLTDGHLMWQQPGDQAGFSPQVVIGGSVYGTSTASPSVGTGSGAPPSLAVSLATGQVQAKSLPTAPVAATDDGYAIVPEIDEDSSSHGGTGNYWIFRAS